LTEPSAVPIRIGISACLLGELVRYDGGHKRDSYLVETLGRYVEWIPVCPEVELGLGTPRETLRLVRIGEDVRMVMPKTGQDHTEGMWDFAQKRVRELEKEDLCGYILKKDSPSCGMERVRVFDARGVPHRAQASADGALAEGLRESRATGGGGEVRLRAPRWRTGEYTQISTGKHSTTCRRTRISVAFGNRARYAAADQSTCMHLEAL
jgi:uncharacterized protein YbbK (DUF523 family)